MVLTAEQHLQIATVYEKAAADMRVPPPHRAAFARKADWSRMLARIGAKKEAAAAASREEQIQEARPDTASEEQGPSAGTWTVPKARPQTIAERLKRARAAEPAFGPVIRSSPTPAL
jgi:hypothetical protein